MSTERKGEYRIARRVLTAEVSLGWVRNRPKLGLMNIVDEALGSNEMTVDAARQCSKYRKAWKALLHM